MEILRAIERADALCPNPYTLEEKLCWCDEVTAQLRREIIKVYDMIETEIDETGNVVLPDDIPFERVENLFYGNQVLEKQDFRSFMSRLSDTDIKYSIPRKIRAVYLDLPKPVLRLEIKGEFNTSENIIEITASPFAEGDKIEICALSDINDEPEWETSKCAYIVERFNDKILLDGDMLEAQTMAPLAIRRVITDFTAIDEAPYDSMYIEYILAKMALYQHDYTGYNAHMTQYNSLYETLRREYKTRSPLTNQVNFKNYSRI